MFDITETSNERQNNLFTLHCLFSSLFRLTPKEISKLRSTGPLWGESTSDRWFPSQRVRRAESVSMAWRHHVRPLLRSRLLRYFISTQKADDKVLDWGMGIFSWIDLSVAQQAMFSSKNSWIKQLNSKDWYWISFHGFLLIMAHRKALVTNPLGTSRVSVNVTHFTCLSTVCSRSHSSQ